jgi:hypothetical protein
MENQLQKQVQWWSWLQKSCVQKAGTAGWLPYANILDEQNATTSKRMNIVGEPRKLLQLLEMTNKKQENEWSMKKKRNETWRNLKSICAIPPTTFCGRSTPPRELFIPRPQIYRVGGWSQWRSIWLRAYFHSFTKASVSCEIWSDDGVWPPHIVDCEAW